MTRTTTAHHPCRSSLHLLGLLLAGASVSGASVAMAADVAPQDLDTVTVEAAAVADEQSRTEPGRLTEATPMAGSVITREELETVKSADSLR
ncbi:MAG: hypothetical protein PHQ14_09620, partial [Chromatiales bacterium]|nr:hypothetical protein [Chromatiales bacterium]